MYALIEKETNKILRTSTEYCNLSPQKPFYWIECPEECNQFWTYDGTNFIPQTPIPPNIDNLRLYDYREESDPLFFKWQRGEIDKQVWLDKVDEIKARYS